MNYKLTILLLFSCIFFFYGQDDRNIKRGKVLEFNNPISGVHLYNLNTLQGTSTLADGSFKLKVKLNDTVIVSHVKYHSLRIVFTQRYLDKEPLIIYMEEMTNYLETVTIRNHDLTGNLVEDSNKQEQQKNKDSLAQAFRDIAYQRSNNDFERNLEKPPKNIVDPTGGPSVGTSVGVGFKFKDLELKKQLKAKKNFPKLLIADMGTPYFTNTLKIPNDSIHHFISYCENKSIMQLYHENEIMKVLMILQEESVEYLKVKD